MRCPLCTGIDLKITKRQGIDIDYCPECRGVWLDREKLDKIIERSDTHPKVSVQPENQRRQDGHNQHHDEKKHYEGHAYGQNGHYKKKILITAAGETK
jgi:Zn-finger nucleic acid-binding protein